MYGRIDISVKPLKIRKLNESGRDEDYCEVKLDSEINLKFKKEIVEDVKVK